MKRELTALVKVAYRPLWERITVKIYFFLGGSVDIDYELREKPAVRA